MNPNAERVVNAWREPAPADTPAEDNVQFERLGYFVADRHDHTRATPVFNRTVTLRDSWATAAR